MKKGKEECMLFGTKKHLTPIEYLGINLDLSMITLHLPTRKQLPESICKIEYNQPHLGCSHYTLQNHADPTVHLLS